MASERSVIDLARQELATLDHEMVSHLSDDTMLNVPLGRYRAVLASLIEHYEALEPFTSLGDLFLSEPSWSDSDDLNITRDFDIRLDERQVGDFRRAASVHTKAQEPL